MSFNAIRIRYPRPFFYQKKDKLYKSRHFEFINLLYFSVQEEEIFQFTVSAALLAMYLAKRTKFLFPNKSANSDPDQDDDFGKSFDISKTYIDSLNFQQVLLENLLPK